MVSRIRKTLFVSNFKWRSAQCKIALMVAGYLWMHLAHKDNPELGLAVALSDTVGNESIETRNSDPNLPKLQCHTRFQHENVIAAKNFFVYLRSLIL